MAYLCGAGTSNTLSMTIVQMGGGTASSFVCGWWKPNTLTAGRVLWAAGANYGMEIDSVTTELRLKTGNLTTNGEWNTTGVNLAVDEWKFIACISSQASNPGSAVATTANWAVWVGTNESIPQEVTVTEAITPVNDFVSSTNLRLGNNLGGASAFQGLLGGALFCRHAGSIQGIVPTTISGTLTTEGKEVVYNRLILPIWKGDWRPSWLSSLRQNNNQSIALYATFLDYVGPIEKDIISGNFEPFGSVSVSGCTLSQERCPRPMPLQPLNNLYVRR